MAVFGVSVLGWHIEKGIIHDLRSDIRDAILYLLQIHRLFGLGPMSVTSSSNFRPK